VRAATMEYGQLAEQILQVIENRVEAVVERLLSPLLAGVVAEIKKQFEIPQEWFSVKQAAVLTGLSSKHIRRAIKRGELLCSDMALEGATKPTYRIARTHLATWMERCQLRQGPMRSARDAVADEFFGRRKGRGRVA
jgi:excisionase family DNA binding protein